MKTNATRITPLEIFTIAFNSLGVFYLLSFFLLPLLYGINKDIFSSCSIQYLVLMSIECGDSLSADIAEIYLATFSPLILGGGITYFLNPATAVFVITAIVAATSVCRKALRTLKRYGKNKKPSERP